MSSNLPVIISDRNELDALCRAWLGFDSAIVERLRQEAEAGRVLYEAVDAVTDMTLNRFYRTLMYHEQKMTLEQWESLELDKALAAYKKAAGA